jgi:DNA-binding LytR/AlgR family response regulator
MTNLPPRILIAEDEPLIRAETLRLLQTHWPDAQVIAQAEDGVEALELWHEHRPDVSLLDIQMPGLTGIQVAQRISQHVANGGGVDPMLVFVTAYDQHALAAFDADAADYLLKPLKAERVQSLVAKLKRRMVAAPSGNSAAQLHSLVAQLSQTLGKPAKEPVQWVSASAGLSIKLVAVADIIYFQSDHKYTRIVTADGEALVRKSLRELLDDIARDQFQQVHRSTVVNMLEVAGVAKDGTGRGRASFKRIADQVDVSAAFMDVFRPA